MRITEYGVILGQDRIPCLVKERSENWAELGVNGRLNSPNLIYEVMCKVFKADILPEEHFWILALNNGAKPLGFFEIAHGGFDFALLDVRSVFVRLVAVGASSFVMIHNHPGGNTQPSTQDISLTKRIVIAARIIGFTVNDHIIVGDGFCTSFLEAGIMEQITEQSQKFLQKF